MNCLPEVPTPQVRQSTKLSWQRFLWADSVAILRRVFRRSRSLVKKGLGEIAEATKERALPWIKCANYAFVLKMGYPDQMKLPCAEC